MMNKLSYKNIARSRGLVVLVSIMALPFLLLLTGFAVDTGRAYLVKAKLFAAVDAAGIAAARAVANGESAATAAATKYFNVNMPAVFQQATRSAPVLTYSNDASGNIAINIKANAEMSHLFLSLFGYESWSVSAQAQTVRRPVDLVLVVDNTTSLRLGSIGDVTQDVVDRSKDFINNFHESFDRVSLVKYAYGAEVPVTFSASRGFSKTDVTTEIDAFTFGSAFNPQYTNASEGFYMALDQIRNITNPANLKVIIFFTDGAPNTFSSNFLFTDNSSHTGSLRSGDGSTGTPRGLWQHDSISGQLSGNGYHGRNIDDNLEELPDYYTAHDPLANEFQVLNPFHTRRPVSQYDPDSNSASDLYTRVNRISRNLIEDMAEAARQEDVYVFTLGLGSSLTSSAGPDNEIGQDLLLRMANDPNMLNDPDLQADFKADQIQGVYCHAVDEQALGPCFEEMLDVIIRLTL